MSSYCLPALHSRVVVSHSLHTLFWSSTLRLSMGRESSGFWIDVLIKLAIPRDPGLQCVGPYLTQPGVSRHASALILCRIKTPKHTGSGLQQDKEETAARAIRGCFPAKTKRWLCVGLMLGRRQRRRTNIKPTHKQSFVFAGKQLETALQL